MKTAYKFRIYPTRQQEVRLDLTLEVCRHLWNSALADRRNTYRETGKGRTYNQQASLLTVEKEYDSGLKGVFSQVLQDVLRRLDKAFVAFFRRLKEGAKKPGLPRFKAEGRYRSITYPQTGFKLEGSKMRLSKIPGSIRVFVHRPVEGKIKTCTIKKDGIGVWYVIFVTERENPAKLKPKTAIGVDLGITHAAVTSDGQYFDYPRYYVQAEKKNREASKSLHRKKPGSNNRKKAKVELARIGKRVTNLREEFQHQVSRKLVDSADLIVFEALNIQGMLKNHCLAKHIQDVSWGKLIRFTQSKAERAGKSVVLVDPRGTSQRCSCCGQVVPKTLKDRVHICPRCGLILCRDLNSSIEIRTLGLRGLVNSAELTGVPDRNLEQIACGDLTATLGGRPKQARSMKQEACSL